jgi:flavin reductase (DIM6/NTAB) family NADH-FMN oxidoreductase RutF
MPEPQHGIHALVDAIDYPMYIVTVASREEIAGCLVGFTTQCSIDPPRFIVCLSDKNHTFRVAQDAALLIVHLVPADRDDLAQLFGSETGDETDKFSQCEWTRGPGGAPVLEACGNWFAGRVLERWTVGDHWAYLLEPTESHGDESDEPFEFHRARRIEPGHEP